MAASEGGRRPGAEPSLTDPGRPERFPDTLRDLLEGKNHAQVAADIGISRSALSQYLTGRSRPSRRTLTKLADYLGVSLDYLLYEGETVQRESLEPGPFARYVKGELVDFERRAADHASLVGRISQVLGSQLGSQVDAAARTVLEDLEGKPVSGMLGDDDTLRFEYHSQSSRIVSMLEDDVIQVAGDVVAEGRFTRAVAQNLSRAERNYMFLLPAIKPWEDVVNGCRHALGRLEVGTDELEKRCLFRETDSFLPIGFVIYELDLNGLRKSDPPLLERFSTHIRSDGLLGYVLPPSRNARFYPVMDEEHLGYAIKAFDELWTAKETRLL